MPPGSSYESPNDIENPPPYARSSVASSIQTVLDNLSPQVSSSSICRVNKRLHRVSEIAYTPQAVSIGPLHHGKEGLKPMEEIKYRYLKDYLRRTNRPLDYYLAKVSVKENDLRGCYAETILFSSEEFVRIVLVDAAFIIEVLLKYRFEGWQDKNDRIFQNPRMFEDVWPDMRMLENQLPFFILEDLFEPERIQFPGVIIEEKPSITNLTYTFFRKLMNIEELDDTSDTIKGPPTVLHFVDFVRKLYPPPPKAKQAREQPETPTKLSMTELYRAGVRFEVGSGKNMFNIEFTGGTLKIPKVTISDYSEANLINLLVFEQSLCKSCTPNYINDYIRILNILVNSPEDVALLVKEGILVNKFGDNKKGCIMIKNMGDGVNCDKKFTFATLCEDLTKHCTKSRHEWLALLRQRYFNTPCNSISFIAAACIILFTLAQTVCSIYSVVNDRGHK